METHASEDVFRCYLTILTDDYG